MREGYPVRGCELLHHLPRYLRYLRAPMRSNFSRRTNGVKTMRLYIKLRFSRAHSEEIGR